jgi:site-specific recombinase XerD
LGSTLYIFSPEQVTRLLNAECLSGKHRVLLMTTYAAGLRISEVCR